MTVYEARNRVAPRRAGCVLATYRDRRAARIERGSGTVEMVIVLPALMILLLLVVQYALWAHANALVQSAAAEGDQAARAVGGTPAAGVVAAQGFLRATGAKLVVGPTVTANVQAGGMARVDVSAQVETILPGIHIGVSATSIGPIQEFRSSG